jgi:sugar-specific transcriptional regulator TrmB
MDLRKVFEELGYPVYQSNILLFLIRNEKHANAKEISAGSEVPLSRVYSILIELERQGLVRSIPGKTTTYTVVDKKDFLQQVGNKKSLDIEKQKSRAESALQLLNQQIEIAAKSPEVTVRHFVSDTDYWAVYNSEAEKMKPGETFRIINSVRWALSLLPSEVENRPGIKSMIENDLKRQRAGLKIHHIVDPEALVQTIVDDLKSKQKIIESISQMLYYEHLPEIRKNHLITIAPEFKNVMIFIMKDSTFFEFYAPGNHTEILSAVQIKSKEITKDFSRWFDTYSREKRNPEQDYEKFKAAVLSVARKTAKIEPKEIEKLVAAMRPVYG